MFLFFAFPFFKWMPRISDLLHCQSFARFCSWLISCICLSLPHGQSTCVSKPAFSTQLSAVSKKKLIADG
jgi:hypothetical protein